MRTLPCGNLPRIVATSACEIARAVLVLADVDGTSEHALASRPLGIVGLPSCNEGTAERVKPRGLRTALLRRLQPAACVLAALVAACGGSDRTAKRDSTAGMTTAAADTIAPPGRFASDATLVIQTTPALAALLRAAADSFAAREAISVVFSAPPEGAADQPLGISPAADLVLVTGDVLSRLPVDSASWALPFAETLPDTAVLASAESAYADSVRRAEGARATAYRVLTRRQRDSARKDSTGRAIGRGFTKYADSLRVDSARTLVLTVPARAPNSSIAERFVRYLLTDGRAALLRTGVHVLPRLAVRGFDAPPGILAVVDTVISPVQADPNPRIDYDVIRVPSARPPE